MLDVAGQHRAGRSRQQGDADVSCAHDLARERGEGIAELHAEGGRTELLRHAEHRLHHRHHLGGDPAGEHRPELLGQRCVQGLGIEAGNVGGIGHRTTHHLLHVLRDWLDVSLPHRQGLLQPLRAAPRQWGASRCRQDGGLIEPHVGKVQGVGDRTCLSVSNDSVAAGLRAGQLLSRDIADHLPVDRPGRAGAACVLQEGTELLQRCADRIHVEGVLAGVTRARVAGVRVVRAETESEGEIAHMATVARYAKAGHP